MAAGGVTWRRRPARLRSASPGGRRQDGGSGVRRLGRGESPGGTRGGGGGAAAAGPGQTAAGRGAEAGTGALTAPRQRPGCGRLLSPPHAPSSPGLRAEESRGAAARGWGRPRAQLWGLGVLGARPEAGEGPCPPGSPGVPQRRGAGAAFARLSKTPCFG